MSLVPQLKALNSKRVLHFIEKLGVYGNLKTACEESGIAREVVMILYDRHPIFRRKFDIAIANAADTLEEEAWKRAMYGYTKQFVTKDGDIIDTIEHDNRLLMAMVKAAKKEKYSEKVTHVGHEGGAIQVQQQHQVNFDNLDEGELKKLLSLMEKARHGAIDADYEEVEDPNGQQLTLPSGS